MINLFVRRLVGGSLAVGVLSGGLWGCSSTDTTGTPGIKTTDPYATLQLNVRAAVMATKAPYDTLQLIPTAYDVNGQVISLPGLVTYTVNDTTLHVTASGLLTVTNVPKTGATVIASVQDTTFRLTHSDTVFISATTTVPASPLASFSIHPVGTDSAVLDVDGGTKTLTVTALDATGTVIPVKSLLIHFASQNPTAGTINAKTGAVTTVYPGTTLLTARTTYYGVTKTDSLAFRIGYPDTTTISTNGTLLPDGSYRYYWTISNLVIGVGKTVIFVIPYFNGFAENSPRLAEIGGYLAPGGDRSINEGVSVVFEDSSVAHASLLPASMLAAQSASTGSGNVSIQVADSFVVVDSVVSPNDPFPQNRHLYSSKLTQFCESTGFPCATARSFPTPGTYTFHSATSGAVGTITVVAP